ncbi:hypothetical protein [Phenylobacterium sp. SCN 70-31]|uniref:c-type cytochrome n=1 Tax=Phenylobacterium sp. SCN 70-31 TaxID=1660129 RepID=UPI00086870B9|nr:hypothetical protein [Phenylobacterium sp. SCN 70-31]ODT88352.1 MAG: hypothetical protein ABS78_06960 [Phenylobacterium sp. SCN 70-31]
MKPSVFLLTATLVLASVAQAHAQTPAQAPDAVLGKRMWIQCRACHAAKPGEPPKAGPSLHGIFGAKAGTKTSFAYSPALKASGIVWTDRTMDDFIASPAKAVKGNRMGYAGMPNARNRAALIAFMKAETQ